MSIWGKLIGGAAGLALGGPIGGFLGALAGHAVDRMRGDEVQSLPPSDDAEALARRDAAESANTRNIAFTIGVVVLGAKMAKADGIVTRDEIAAFREVFRVPDEDEQNVAKLFNMARRDAHGFEPYARQISSLFRPGSPVLEELLGGLFHIARADGKVTEDEIEYLRALSGIFGFSNMDFERVRANHVPPDVDDPYVILGVVATASDDEVRSAYRKLLRVNHPDKLIAQGLPPELIERANQKMARINHAYDQIQERRGVK